MLGDWLLGNYKRVAEQLGLTIDGGVGQDHLLISGSVDGTSIEMWFGTHATHARARLARDAPISLQITARSWWSRLFGRARGIGDPTFDARLAVRLGDPDRIAALISYEARRELVDLARRRLHPEVAHDCVQLRMFSNGGSDSPAKILALLQATSHLGKTVEASFAR